MIAMARRSEPYTERDKTKDYWTQPYYALLDRIFLCMIAMASCLSARGPTLNDRTP